MFTQKRQIEEALSRTGRRLALAGAGEYALLVCGGSALCLEGLIQRPTNDVDVLGFVTPTTPHTITAQLLPEEVAHAAALVARDLGLALDWLNDSATDVQRLGLPPGILQRARRIDFGPCLSIFVISRQDQVALKLYAALDVNKGQRHQKDLEALVPSKSELEAAIQWLLDRKTSPQFRSAVKSVVESLGFKGLSTLKPKSTGTTGA